MDRRRAVIVVAGEALVDLIVDPMGGLTAVPGGGPFNAARTLGLLGADCTYLGVLAGDHFGELLRSQLAAASVKLACPTATAAPTTLAVAQLDGAGSATYRFYLEGTSIQMLSGSAARGGMPAEFDALHIGTLGIVVEPTASVLEQVAVDAAADHLIMVDPNCRPAIVTDFPAFRDRAIRLMKLADLIKVSVDDVAFLFPEGGFEDLVADLAEAGKFVVQTAGAGPIDVFARGRRDVVHPPTGGVVDTVGAGDIFGATLLWALTRAGWRKGHDLGLGDLLAAVTTAAVAGHLSCQSPGASPPSLAELDARLVAGVDGLQD